MKTEVENFNKEIDGLVEMAILSNNFDEVCGIHKKTTDLFEQIRFENDDDEGSELIKFKHAVNALDKIASRMYESPRELRRLHYLREWSHEQDE